MTSNIDPTVPVTGNPTTASVRQNFAVAQMEISALQVATVGAPFLPIAGSTMGGPLYLDRDPTAANQAVTKRYVDLSTGSGGVVGVPEAPSDGNLYGRQSGAWIQAARFSDITAALVPASETVAGIIRIATTAQVSAGTDNTAAVTSSKLAAQITTRLGPYVRTDATSIGFTAANLVNFQPSTGSMQLYISAVQSGTSPQILLERPDNLNQAAIYGLLAGGEVWRLVLGDITTNNLVIRRATGANPGNMVTLDATTGQISFNPEPGAHSGMSIWTDQTGIGPTIICGPLTASSPATDYFLIAARRVATGAPWNRDGGLVVVRGPSSTTNPGGVELTAGSVAGGYHTALLDNTGNFIVAAVTTALANIGTGGLSVNGGEAITNGFLRIQGNVADRTTYIRLGDPTSTRFCWMYLNDTNGTIGFQTMLATAYLASNGVWTDASDRRLKDNIRPIHYGLDAVLALEPVAFEMGGQPGIGLIAQDVEAIIPEVVVQPREGGNYGLAYGNLVAVLVAAIHDLAHRLDRLEGDDA